jgi:SnoaL-like domain
MLCYPQKWRILATRKNNAIAVFALWITLAIVDIEGFSTKQKLFSSKSTVDTVRSRSRFAQFLPRTLNAAIGNFIVQEAASDAKSIDCVLSMFSEWYSIPSSEVENACNKDNTLVSIIADNVVWDDCHYMYKPLLGVNAVERHLRLQKINLLGSTATKFVIDRVVVAENSPINRGGVDRSTTNATTVVGFTFHASERTNGIAEGMAVPNHRGIVILDLESVSNSTVGCKYHILAANIIREKSYKSGELGLRVLSLASSFLSRTGENFKTISNARDDSSTLTLPERYFDSWNKRDIDAAVSLFTENISYDDTAFPHPFVGKEYLRQHLNKCVACFPKSFTFHVDRVLQQQEGKPLIVTWHVENGGQPLPYTNGMSYYELNPIDKKISLGIDFVDSESIKVAAVLDPIVALFRREPIRWVPTTIWLVYIYVVFVSSGILPGANAFQFELRTWEEVRDLSLNFFLVAPVLKLPFSPVVHPMLEGVFNVLLSWAAMFAGFLSDDRRTKPSLLPMFPMVVGMQFLTSAFLLPYLVTRTPECYDKNLEKSSVVISDLAFVSQITENRLWGPSLAFVGSYSILWSIFGRWTEFGDLTNRWESFTELLSMDRVGSSFIVDLIIFAIFQGWLVDDDLQRRGVPATEMLELRRVAKVFPFFGMAVYLAARPPFPLSTDKSK